MPVVIAIDPPVEPPPPIPLTAPFGLTQQQPALFIGPLLEFDRLPEPDSVDQALDELFPGGARSDQTDDLVPPLAEGLPKPPTEPQSETPPRPEPPAPPKALLGERKRRADSEANDDSNNNPSPDDEPNMDAVDPPHPSQDEGPPPADPSAGAPQSGPTRSAKRDTSVQEASGM